MEKRTIIRIALALAMCGISLLIFRGVLFQNKDVIRIAMVGPMSGPDASLGRDVYRGIMMYLDMINAGGEISGRNIVLDVYDDQNDVQHAEEKALEIVQHNRAVAVIGHVNSAGSITAGKIYKANGIPAITPASTNSDVTSHNDWYFRTVFNDSRKGRFIVKYVKEVFKYDSMSMISSEKFHGSHLEKVIVDSSKEIGIDIKYRWNFKKNNLKNIIDDLQLKKDAGVIILLTSAYEGINLVKSIKDAGIENILIGTEVYAEEEFRHGFDTLARESRVPGHYTNGLYVSTPLIYDIANEEAQHFEETYRLTYKDEPDWLAAYAYDTVKLIVEAIKANGITGGLDAVKLNRIKIRNFLAGLNSHHAIEGITGQNYFDANGDAPKQVWMGTYKNTNIVSALTQFQPIHKFHEDLDSEKERGRIVYIDQEPMYKTNIVYTGIQLNEISALNLEDSTCTLDFYLWFRYRDPGAMPVQDMQFLNAVGPVALDPPLHAEVRDQLTYHLYHIKGTFKADFLPSHYRPFGQSHILGVSFRHRELTQDNLVYVKDMLGMELDDEHVAFQTLKEAYVLDPKSGWLIHDAWFFQNTEKVGSLGAPTYLNRRGGREFSRFNMEVEITKGALFLRGLIPKTWAHYLLILGVGIFVLLWMAKPYVSRDYDKYIWTLQALVVFLAILAGEVAIISWLTRTRVALHLLENTIVLFDVLWWIVLACCFISVVERFLWRRLESKTSRTIPKLVRHFGAFLILTLASFGIIAFVFDMKITGLLATSGVVAMIVGLAIQINISNIFSGIAINVERPFRVDDWVKIGTLSEAKVIDINWRTTRLLTRYEEVISVPNHTVAESIIYNYHYPDDHYWVGFTVHIDPAHPIEQVEQVLQEAVRTMAALTNPWVVFAGMSAWAAEYWVYAIGRDFATKIDNQLALWRHVKRHLDQAGMSPIIQRQEIHVFEGTQQRQSRLPLPLQAEGEE